MTGRDTGAGRTARRTGRASARPSRETSEPARSTALEDMAALGDRLKQAEALLEARRQTPYSTPWYLVIGPRAAGKTAWLSGLGMPNDAIREGDTAAPTVTCDVLVYEEAVFLDVAGRLVSQDVDPQADRMAWAGLLRLLLKRRPTLPISGMIVMVPAETLADTEDRRGAVAAMRLRLRELGRMIGGKLPVYLVATKLDLAPGCFAMLSALDDDETDQVWGVTFNKQRPTDDAQRAGFEDLIARLADQVILRQHHGMDERMAAGMWLLPRDLARLAAGTVSLGSAIVDEPALMLRGFYLSAHPAAVRDTRRTAVAPFARPLFETVILREAGMASRPQPRRATQILHLAVAPLLALILGAGFAWSYGENRETLNVAEAAAAEIDTALAPIPLTEIAESDPSRVLPIVNGLDWFRRELPTPRISPWLSDGSTVRMRAASAYLRSLEFLIEPRLLLGLERAIAVEGPRGMAAQAYLGVGTAPSRSTALVAACLAQSPWPTLTRDSASAFGRHAETLLRAAQQPLDVHATTLSRLQAWAGRAS
ncbi:MAG: hypothetical protein FJX54_04965 [Alphaproteobacteria bacterium]|nr:hypothetical protein [Alphaproteobacteria bacterium]